MQIVGVTADTKYRRLRGCRSQHCVSAVRTGARHRAGTERTLYVRRTWGDPADLSPQIREQVRALDQNLRVEIGLFSGLC